MSATGVPGVDEILKGGIPGNKLTLIVGPPGSGKTTFGLQYLANGVLQFGEPGLMVSFEESPESLIAGAASLSHCATTDLAELHFIDGRPSLEVVSSGTIDLGGLVAIVRDFVERLNIKRVVFDGLDALFNDGIDLREFRRLLQFTAEVEVSALALVKESAADKAAGGPASNLDYFADAVVRLASQSKDGLLRRVLCVDKVRQSSFLTGDHFFVISDRGIHVDYWSVEKRPPVLSAERVSTGIARLDDMQEGGLLRSSVTLISGLPGTAKSTIGASFLAAALERGERALLIALDEPAAQLVRNVRSVGIDLESAARDGRLQMLSLNAGAVIADEHYLAIERAIDEYAPAVLVIDPISALEKGGGKDVANTVTQRLSNLVKERGLTAIFTALAESQLGELEATSSQISTIADTWIHVSYAERGGERNRTLTIIKSRGTAHSNQLRELVISREGIGLQDVYQLEGEVLLGSARFAREMRDVRDRQNEQRKMEGELRDLEKERVLAELRVQDAQLHLSTVVEQMSTHSHGAEATVNQRSHDRDELVAHRTTDGEPGHE